MNNEQHQARMDGEQDAETDVSRILWIVVGFGVSLIGVLIAFVYQPSPPASRLFEKSQEYVMFYTEAYKSKVKKYSGDKYSHWSWELVSVLVFCSLYLYLE